MYLSVGVFPRVARRMKCFCCFSRHFISLVTSTHSTQQQDGWLAPTYFLHNYKYFDQLLQTVKNETTVLDSFLKGFLQKSIPPLISIFYAKEGVSGFSVEFFCLRVPKKIVGEHFNVSENFGYRKFFCKKGGYHDFLSENFCLTQPKNFVGEPICLSESFWCREKFMHKTSILWKSVENFTIHTTKKLRRGTLLCFTKLPVSKTVRDERGGGYYDFPSKLFPLTVRKHFAEEAFYFSKTLSY